MYLIIWIHFHVIFLIKIKNKILPFSHFREESLKLLKKLQNLQQDQINVNDIVTEFTLNNVIGMLYDRP